MTRQLSRSIIGAGACIGAGLALQPLYAEPSLHALALQGGELVLRGGVSIAFTLACAYCIHRIKAWAAERPVMPAPSQVYAVTQHLGPELAGEVARAQADERHMENDLERQTRQALIRFCIIGEGRQSFAFQEMKENVDRPTWDRLTDYLAVSGVLRIGSGRRPTWFREGWNAVCVRVALKRGLLELPSPILYRDDVPMVVWSDYRHAMHASKHTNTQAR